ncbi:MAG: chorismate mutase [Dehalococcoidales bacterium]|nr:chorismate mutase [Dehalococcoidales bacterium]
MPVRGIRGATTAVDNTRQHILEATTELLTHVVQANDLQTADIAAAFFTTTPDLDATFPALAARLMGWTTVPLMGAQEAAVPGSLSLCIRLLLLVNTEKAQVDVRNVYEKGATSLRESVSRDLS